MVFWAQIALLANAGTKLDWSERLDRAYKNPSVFFKLFIE